VQGQPCAGGRGDEGGANRFLHQVVQLHLETYRALARKDDWEGQRVPAYVEREYRRYLECGILAYG
jgi:hypothetical protein